MVVVICCLAAEVAAAAGPSATFYWTGEFGPEFDGRVIDGQRRYNWMTGPDRYTLVRATRNPTANDHVWIDGHIARDYGRKAGDPPGRRGAPTVWDCDWGDGPRRLRSFHVVSDYYGTVRLKHPLTVPEFHFTSGHIDQATAAEITVTERMYWPMNGMLDSTPETPSVLRVTGPGTVATIFMRDASGGNALFTSDTIRVENGAELQLRHGMLYFAAGRGIEVTNAKVVAEVDAGAKRLAFVRAGLYGRPATNSDARIALNDGGRYSVVRTDPDRVGEHTSELPFAINGTDARLAVYGKVRLTVSGRLVDPAGPVPGYGAGVWQGKGRTEVWADSILDAAGGLRIDGGEHVTGTK